MKVCFTVDIEQDCPPYLNTWRGIEEGLPRLLKLLESEKVPATCFTTGEVARRYPEAVRAVVAAGHELGCHGDTHAAFDRMRAADADRELAAASSTLRSFGQVDSFRAPYLRFPRAFVPLLARHGYSLDSSEGRHKRFRAIVRREGAVLRIPASITSSTLRWPPIARNLLLAQLAEPVVVFVHPWEFIDLRRERLRFDCRFRTGDAALEATRTTLRFFADRGAQFLRMSACAGA